LAPIRSDLLAQSAPRSRRSVVTFASSTSRSTR
jgi:hypothetical protein